MRKTLLGIDLAICSLWTIAALGSRIAWHSTTHQAANIAKRANARKLIIGHYSIRYDDEQQFEQEVKSIFPNAEACNEGMVFSV